VTCVKLKIQFRAGKTASGMHELCIDRLHWQSVSGTLLGRCSLSCESARLLRLPEVDGSDRPAYFHVRSMNSVVRGI